MNSKLTIGFLAASVLAGCASSPLYKAEKNVKDVDSELTEKMNQGTKIKEKKSSVRVKNELFIGGKVFNVDEKELLPELFKKPVGFSQLDPISFQEIIGIMSSDMDIKIVLTTDAIEFLSDDSGSEDQPKDEENVIVSAVDFSGAGLVGDNIKFSLVYQGTARNALDQITNKANLFWKWDGTQVVIFRNETKNYTFDGDDLTNSFTATVTSTRNSGENSGESTTNQGSSHSTSITSNPESIYKSLEESLKSMMSKNGTFSVSKDSGIVTVTDTPLVQRKVSEFIEQTNSILNRRIGIKTMVYEVTLDENGEIGSDLDLLFSGSDKFGFSTMGNFVPEDAVDLSMGFFDSKSNFNGSKAFINALNKVADVSLKTTSTVFTTSGKPTPVQVGSEKGFVKEIKIQESSNSDSAPQYSIEQGTILSGFSMSIMPKINSTGRIDLQVAVDMSLLKNLEKVNVGNEGAMVQTPERDFKNFIQRVSLDSGNTVLITGFERTEDTSNVESLGGRKWWMFGGNKKGGVKKVKTMILMTPYIISN